MPLTANSRWADIIDSDHDDSQAGLLGRGLATVPEDCSYQGLAVPGLETSKDGLNAAFLENIALEEQKPSGGTKTGKGKAKQGHQDFGFLLKEDEERDQENVTENDEPVADYQPARLNSTLNPAAPDFIPTCNPAFVPVAVIVNPTVINGHPVNPSPLKRNHDGTRSVFLIGDGEGTEGVASLKNDRKRSRMDGNFRRRGHGSSFSEKRSSDTGTPTNQNKKSSGLAQGEMPDATEEEWQHRTETRRKNVEAGKATADYKRYLDLVPKDTREPTDPKTPRHEDRTSRGDWKAQIKAWRLAVTERVKGENSDQRLDKDNLTIEGAGKASSADVEHQPEQKTA